jgi:hypothetical protein
VKSITKVASSATVAAVYMQQRIKEAPAGTTDPFAGAEKQ